MNAKELDTAIAESTPVCVATEAFGVVVCHAVERRGQRVCLVCMGQYLGVSAFLQKLQNVSAPTDLTPRFLPPGHVLLEKGYDVMPCDTWGFSPAELLTRLEQCTEKSQNYRARISSVVYGAAANLFRKTFGAGLCLWMLPKEAGRPAQAAAVARWLSRHGDRAPAGRVLKSVSPRFNVQRYLKSKSYLEAMLAHVHLVKP